MKRLILIALLFFAQVSIGQPPASIPYQAVARDNAGNLIINQAISLRFSIRDSIAIGIIIYREAQSKTTNALGLFTANIGEGTPVIGTFASIDWTKNNKFIQVELDPTGGNSFTDMGTKQMLSVPFALNAANGNWTKSGNTISNANSGNVAVGTTSPASSAKLDVTSTTQGFLPPRMTYAQRNLISSPVAGLIIWCTDCGTTGALQVYNGFAWDGMNSSGVYYPSATNCGQVWMSKNLDVSTYSNGDPIPKVTDPVAWSNLTTGAYCYYNNDSASYASTYGKLYNWYALNDVRGLAPSGWHLPTDVEWTALNTCNGGIAAAGGPLKETGTVHWSSPNTSATNSSGFTGLPGGTRSDLGSFTNLSQIGFYWTSTENNATTAFFNYLFYTNGSVTRTFYNKRYGFSVRCIKN